MFTAIYPASFIRVRAVREVSMFDSPDLPEALTGGDDLPDTRVQAADCLAEAIAGRIRRGDKIPLPSRPKRGQYLIGLPLYLHETGPLPRDAGTRPAVCGLARRLGVRRNRCSSNARSPAQYKTGED